MCMCTMKTHAPSVSLRTQCNRRLLGSSPRAILFLCVLRRLCHRKSASAALPLRVRSSRLRLRTWRACRRAPRMSSDVLLMRSLT